MISSLLRFFSPPKVPRPLVTRGNVYDLQKIYGQVMQEYFPGHRYATIGWSNRARVGRFRSITFGTYNHRHHQIRIHPLLDHEEVPLYFLEFLIYHEMLHAVCPPERGGYGKGRIHTRAFQSRERQHPHYERAKAWGKNSLKLFKKRIHGRA